MRVALFVTCLGDTAFPGTGRAVVSLLERLGHEVEFPMGQTCCGQLHFNTGYQRDALTLARRFVRVFAEAEAIITPSGSCAGMVREFYPYLAEQAGDTKLSEAASELATRIFELSEFLIGRLGIEDVGASLKARIVYHPTCHSLRLLRVGDAPLRLLRAVRGAELVELARAHECCGFGGTFSLKNAEVSTAMVEDKVAAVIESGADVVTAVDDSCLMNIRGALSRRRAPVRALHLAEILAS